MDGGGRVAEPLTGPGVRPGAQPRPKASAARRAFARFRWTRLRGVLRSVGLFGLAAALLTVFAGLVYVADRGGRLPILHDWLNEARDAAANAAGFRIASLAIAGHRHLSRDEILAIAGIGGRTSLLFLDAAEARAKLKANPWVADATVQKLYPDRLTITVTERQAFALWQKAGQINVIADDGTVLESFVSRGVMTLPFVVGAGAEARAKDFLKLLGRHPAIGEQVRASVLVGERRWNLRLRNGVDVKLPETDVGRALAQLAALDQEKKLLARDIVAVDLRQADRIAVRLSEAAAAAREEALKAKRPKPKGGSA